MASGRLRAVACCLLIGLTTGCGQKGPPLAPFAAIPAAVTGVSATRVGAQVIVQFTVPATNVDGRTPANLERVELYVHTTRLLVAADYLTRGTLVGSVAVRRPQFPEADEEEAATPAADPALPAELGPEAALGVAQGDLTTIVDTIEASDLVLGPAPKDERQGAEPEPNDLLFPDGGGPLLSPRRGRTPTLFYVLAGVNAGGRRGPFSSPLEVPLVDVPGAPTGVQLTYTEDAVTLTWLPPVVPLRRPIQTTLDADEPSAADGTDPSKNLEAPAEGANEAAEQVAALPARSLVPFAASGGYNVYQVNAPRRPIPSPLNPAPLTELVFEDPRVAFGVETCYAVRAQETIGANTSESTDSEPACVTPVDTFPPMAPQELTAVASEGAVNLLWNANDERDLTGYLVLRGEAPGERLQALHVAPIAEATFRDTTARGGVTYVYAIVAQDESGNLSAQSSRVEAMAR